MKKIFVLTILVLLVSTSAFAGTYGDSATITGSAGASGTETISVLSNNVNLGVLSSPSTFAVTAAHTNGSKKYGTSSDVSNIYAQSYDAGTAVDEPSNSDSGEFASGWTAM